MTLKNLPRMIGHTLFAFCGSATDITERKRAEQQLQRAFAESERLLAEAAQYVKALLPEPMAARGIIVDWRFQPSAALGGDCFGYHWLDADHFALYLIDVSGHGVDASLLAVTVLNVLRSQTLKDADFYSPGNVLGSLNRAFQMDNHSGMYLPFRDRQDPGPIIASAPPLSTGPA